MSQEKRAEFLFNCDYCSEPLKIIITKTQAKRTYKALQAGNRKETNRLLNLVGGIHVVKDKPLKKQRPRPNRKQGPNMLKEPQPNRDKGRVTSNSGGS